MHPFERCRSKDGMRQFVLKAQERGFDEICFTEHCPLPSWAGERWMSESLFEKYVDFTFDLQKEFSSVRIKLGIELDYYPNAEEYLANLTDRYPFDYIIGSVHIHTSIYKSLIKDKSFDNVCKIALKLEQEAVKSGIFDTLGHFDFYRWLCDSVRFNKFKDAIYESERYKEETYELLKLLEKKSVCVEINSSGLKKSFAQILPCPEILSWSEKFDLKYTFASDAHVSEHVGDGYDDAMEIMSESQRSRLVTFRSRKPVILSDEKMVVSE